MMAGMTSVGSKAESECPNCLILLQQAWLLVVFNLRSTTPHKIIIYDEETLHYSN